MQRRQILELGKTTEHGLVNQDRPVEIGTAMDHAVTDCPQLDTVEVCKPLARLADSSGKVRYVRRLVCALDQYSFSGCRTQARPHTDAIELATDAPLGLPVDDFEDLKLEARRAGVDDKDCVHFKRHSRQSGGARQRKEPPLRRMPNGS